MNSFIKFCLLEGDKVVKLPSHDIELIDEDDELEKQILIGLGIELDGKHYRVVNQIIENGDENKDIVYYLEPE